MKDLKTHDFLLEEGIEQVLYKFSQPSTLRFFFSNNDHSYMSSLVRCHTTTINGALWHDILSHPYFSVLHKCTQTITIIIII